VEQQGQIRFDWREGLALISALGRGALDSDPGAGSVPVSGLAQRSACHRAGSIEALGKLPPRLREKLLRNELKAVRRALLRLADLGLVVWDYSQGDDALTYQLTERGWDTAVSFGRRVVKARPAEFAAISGGMAAVGHM
jgi:hypothetical protein